MIFYLRKYAAYIIYHICMVFMFINRKINKENNNNLLDWYHITLGCYNESRWSYKLSLCKDRLLQRKRITFFNTLVRRKWDSKYCLSGFVLLRYYSYFDSYLIRIRYRFIISIDHTYKYYINNLYKCLEFKEYL